jgi:hypothetical protein
VNLSNTTPAAPSGTINLKWQADGHGNISGYIDLGNLVGTVNIAGGNAEGLRITNTSQTPFALMINNLNFGSTDVKGFGMAQLDAGSAVMVVNNVTFLVVDITGVAAFPVGLITGKLITNTVGVPQLILRGARDGCLEIINNTNAAVYGARGVLSTASDFLHLFGTATNEAGAGFTSVASISGVTGIVLVGNGTTAAPSLAQMNHVGTGFHFKSDGSNIIVATLGTDQMAFNGATGINLAVGNFFGWSSSADPTVASDTTFKRAAAKTVWLGTNGDATGTFNTAVLIENASHTPSSSSDTGVQGQIAWDTSYIYICSATNTWLRAAIATW